MRIQINFQIINPEYDPKYAKEYHNGKESDSNRKYIWSTKLEIEHVKSIELIENGIYQLQGHFNDGSDFDIPIPNITIFRCHIDDKTFIDFGVSKSILNKTHQTHNENYNITRCYFYINIEPKSEKLGNLILSENEIPEILKSKQS